MRPHGVVLHCPTPTSGRLRGEGAPSRLPCRIPAIRHIAASETHPPQAYGHVVSVTLGTAPVPRQQPHAVKHTTTQQSHRRPDDPQTHGGLYVHHFPVDSLSID